jgi:hypothetical protein
LNLVQHLAGQAEQPAEARQRLGRGGRGHADRDNGGGKAKTMIFDRLADGAILSSLKDRGADVGARI